MAISIGVTSTKVNADWAGSLVIPELSEVADDDILAMTVYHYGGTSITLPSGFNDNKTTVVIGSDKMTSAWKRASSESGDYTVSTDGQLGAGIITVIEGCKTTDSPLNVAISNTGYLTSNTTIRAAALTPTVEVALVWMAYNWDFDITVPGTFTQQGNVNFLENRLALATKLAVSSGDTGVIDGASASASDWKHAMMYALAPATGGVATPTISAEQSGSSIVVSWS